ncbi:MAG: hypothetical protein LW808_000360 [Verrucomicrobiota bacterium]|nr:MAG: hypothetical protein LW808_000360 [Verrucomicrobiota bacterium]
MKKRTLREQVMRAKAEALLQKMGAPLTSLDAVEEAPIAVLDPLEVRAQAEATLQQIENFFQKLGFSEDHQEALFELPAIKECLDEIATTVTRERMELERLFGKPREGWQRLPYESELEVEPILEIPESPEPIKEIRVTEVRDVRAAEQLAAIQEKLANAFETVQEIQKQQFKVPELPRLRVSNRPEDVKVAPQITLPEAAKPQFRFNEEVGHHYADQLQIVVETDPLEEAIEQTAILKNGNQKPVSTAKAAGVSTKSSGNSTPAKTNAGLPQKKERASIEFAQKDPIQSSETIRIEAEGNSVKVRKAEEILAALDALSEKESEPEPEPVMETVVPEVIMPDSQLLSHRASTTATHHGNVVLATLRAQQQRENPEKSLAETILENVTSTNESVDGTEHRLASTLRRGGFRRISL